MIVDHHVATVAIKIRDGGSVEDEQAVIVNAGKAKKYKSNREVYDAVMSAPAG